MDHGREKVLEVYIPKSENAPHKAPGKNGHYKAYIREADENLLANGVQMKIWKKQKSRIGIRFSYRNEEKLLLELLKEEEKISVSQFRKEAAISRYQAENILANFVLLDLAYMKISKGGCFWFFHTP